LLHKPSFHPAVHEISAESESEEAGHRAAIPPYNPADLDNASEGSLQISERTGLSDDDVVPEKTWYESVKKGQIFFDFSRGVYDLKASWKFRIFETLTFLNLYNY
jgi:hypothetical protein